MQASSNPISTLLFARLNQWITNMGRRKGDWVFFSRRKKDRADGGRRGTFDFITLRIPDTFGSNTGHIRYLQAGCLSSKIHSLDSKTPSRSKTQSKRYTILIQSEYSYFPYLMPWFDILFSKYLAYLWFWIFERDLVRHWDMIRRCIWVYGLERVIPFVISQASNQWEQ